MKYLFKKGLVSCALAASLSITAQAAPVALELALVIDVSGSISAAEYALQRQGYVNAFSDPTIQANILSFAPSGGIAVGVFQFSTDATQVINWTLIDDAGDLTSFIGSLNAMSRSTTIGANTDVSDGMNIGIAGITGNGYEGARLVIDVSGDGVDNVGGVGGVIAARNNAQLQSIVINGLPIGPASVATFYQTNVITTTGFLEPAASFADFGDAVTRKIGREIIGGGDDPLPLPGVAWMLGAGLLGLGTLVKRTHAA
jgi:hypothetical protein